MDYTSFSEFIKDFCTYPLSLILLAIIIVIAVVWFFKYKPKEEAEKRKRDDEFLRAQERYEAFMGTQTQLYQAALDNSTKAIENNTAVVKMLTERINAVEANQRVTSDSLKDLETKEDRLIEKAVEINLMLKGRDM